MTIIANLYTAKLYRLVRCIVVVKCCDKIKIIKKRKLLLNIFIHGALNGMTAVISIKSI